MGEGYRAEVPSRTPSPLLSVDTLRCPLPQGERANAGRASHAETPLPGAVAQHEAGAAGAADAAAQRFGGGARVGAHAHLVERLRAAAAQDRAEQTRIAPGEEVGVAPGERGVVGERVVARETGGELHADRKSTRLNSSHLGI